MASEEHIELANFIKEVHTKLRYDAAKVGSFQAWQKHCQNKQVLQSYAKCMEKLATTFWTDKCASDSSEASSRIQWSAEFCYNYFINKSYLQHQEKEIEIAKKINVILEKKQEYSDPIKLLDVGSCYNPFRIYDFIDVTAIDLWPANDSVLQCDFLDVSIDQNFIETNSCVKQLQADYYDVVTFCFLLEYIPTSELRIKACKNAYTILKPGGILIVNTPDSKHVGANSKIIKSWQYTLAHLGFTRIKYEKLKYMHCMAFRKAVCKETALRWATIYKQSYMELSLHIPQDYNIERNENKQLVKINLDPKDFKELPFSEL